MLTNIHPILTAPFVCLLLCIAIIPLINKRWWEKNYAWLPLLFGAMIVSHYWFNLNQYSILLNTAHEYISFIFLIGSLYVVAGGIHIRVKGEGTPVVNCLFLFLGALLANIIGTTGASMILIRPWMRLNKHRFNPFHIVFFIFIVSNIGGGLTPIGDPPLFLGYLKGIPFFWVLSHIGFLWSVTIALLLIVFYSIDRYYFSCHKKIHQELSQIKITETKWHFEGLLNILYLLIIIEAVFINKPPFVREALMFFAAALSYKTTSIKIHEKNDFNFDPLKEVAFLFAGIFSTMIPALQWLESHASDLGIRTPGQFFWASGILSSVLDNAPTYLNFLSTEIGLFAHHLSLNEHEKVAWLINEKPLHVLALSTGAVFFGAMTYIGNGPNFLVKSIIDQSRIKTPSFFGYIFKYSLPILVPIFTLVWFFFLRGF